MTSASGRGRFDEMNCLQDFKLEFQGAVLSFCGIVARRTSRESEIMAGAPEVSPGEWIPVGERGLLEAVVCVVFDEPQPNGALIRCVYLDGSGRAISGEMEWCGGYWAFARQPGEYVDEAAGLEDCVRILKEGHH